MRWIAILVLIPAVSLTMFGCTSTQHAYQPSYTESVAAYEPTGPTTTQDYAPEPAYTPGSSSYGLSTDATLASRSAPEPVTTFAYEEPVDEPRIHVVTKSDTLYSLARLYYNSASRWKDIYQANQADITDPNKIYVGQRLVIP